MKKQLIGIGFGAIAGIIDVIPMLIMKLPWDADLSAFTMWLVIGFLLTITNLKMKGIFKGLFISFLVLLPISIIIGAKNPKDLIPVLIMTTLLGSSLGFIIDKIVKVDD